MTVLITLTVAGTDSGPFNLYSNIDGFTSAFETGVSKASLLAGYSSALVPDYTTVIRVLSTGDCTNYIDITLDATPTSSTTSTSTTLPVPVAITMTLFGSSTDLAACASIVAGLDPIATRYSTSSYLNPGDTIYNGPGLTNPATWPVPTYYGYTITPGPIYAWAYVATNGVVINSGYCS
jgi:hypothetical protein